MTKFQLVTLMFMDIKTQLPGKFKTIDCILGASTLSLKKLMTLPHCGKTTRPSFCFFRKEKFQGCPINGTKEREVTLHSSKIVTWILMKIPCHKLTVVWSNLTPDSMTIPCHLSRFYFLLFSILKHDMDFGKVQVMEFPWHLPRK